MPTGGAIFIMSPTWTECKRGYVYKTGHMGTGYYKDDKILESEAHIKGADEADEATAKRNEEARLAKEKAEKEAEEAAAAKAALADKVAAMGTIGMAEKPPLELLAEKFAKQQAAKALENAEKKVATTGFGWRRRVATPPFHTQTTTLPSNYPYFRQPSVTSLLEAPPPP